MLSESLLTKIRCPIYFETLTPASLEWIELLNSELQQGRLFDQLGVQVEQELTEGLVNQSSSCFIRVQQGIPELTPDKTIPIDHLEIPGQV